MSLRMDANHKQLASRGKIRGTKSSLCHGFDFKLQEFFHKQRLALTYHLFVGWGGRWVCWTLLGSNHTFDFGVDLDLDLDPAKLD